MNAILALAALCCLFATSHCVSEEELFALGYQLAPGVGYYKVHTEPKSWTDAQATCLDEGGHLVIPNVPQEKKVLSSLMDEFIPDLYTDIYVGIHTLYDDNAIALTTGVPLNTTGLTYYLSGIPNCGVSYFRLDMFFWNPPDREQPFICEQELWTTYELVRGLGYYKLHTEGKTWAEAFQICVDEGAHLAVVRSAIEALVLRIILLRNPQLPDTEDNDNVAVGFHLQYDTRTYVADKDKTYNTIFGGTVKNSGYSNWARGQPTAGTRNHCGSINRDGQYFMADCHAKLAFFCKKDL